MKTLLWNGNLGLLHSLSQIIIAELQIKYAWHLIKARYEDRMAFFRWINRKVYITDIPSICLLLNSYSITESFFFRKLLRFSHFHSFPAFKSPTALA